MIHTFVYVAYVDIDDDLIHMVIDRYSIATKKEAVDFALRRVVGGVMTKEQALAMEGSGWDGDLDDVRGPMVIGERRRVHTFQ